ncbi:hypothetical protein UUU_14570 [Klebsiella pneumoniae subsp. pneumoniae DSM 30104 = JCM 1662 = NBRC 14940]|nr:hypothetical protein UUU_14570 [Klebsiella pneumoniae subsp. pneumoniae DSM 30104 = JCM 1662 = NBRC 14940]CDK62981.1 hypothetical protein [Klebsiella pneumoniae IS10]
MFDGYHVSISLPVKIYINLHKLYPDVAKKPSPPLLWR